MIQIDEKAARDKIRVPDMAGLKEVGTLAQCELLPN